MKLKRTNYARNETEVRNMNYYNENDDKAATWLRELISRGLIPDGRVDSRSISEVKPDDLKGYTQCHFFAGIGGWSYALQLAGWPADRPVWTGSCPCQPFSTAGKGLAQKDERHLWPVFFDLIRQRRPEHVFGEQVASAIGHGWLDGISSDLEAEGYACGAAVLGAHSVNSPHQRQRLYWVANSNNTELQRQRSIKSGLQSGPANSSGLVLSDRDGCSAGSHAATAARYGNPADTAGFWADFQLVHCRDGKTRRVPTEPAFFPLDHGIPSRVVRLRGYGNAIVPQVAAGFVQAYIDICATSESPFQDTLPDA